MKKFVVKGKTYFVDKETLFAKDIPDELHKVGDEWLLAYVQIVRLGTGRNDVVNTWRAILLTKEEAVEWLNHHPTAKRASASGKDKVRALAAESVEGVGFLDEDR